MDWFEENILENLIDLLITLELRNDFTPTEKEGRLISLIKSNLKENFEIDFSEELKVRSLIENLRDIVNEASSKEVTVTNNENLLKNLNELLATVEK